MKLPITTLLACVCVSLAGCGDQQVDTAEMADTPDTPDMADKTEPNPFVGQWEVTIECLDHEGEPGHKGATITQKHFDGTYAIAARGDNKFYLKPESGAFKDEFSACDLDYSRGQGKMPDGTNFKCQTFNPGPGAMRLSGTCDLMHPSGPTPHAVQVFLVKDSSEYGGDNPVIQFGHNGPAHAGWLH